MFVNSNGEAAAGVGTTLLTVGADQKACVDICLCKKAVGVATVSISVTVGAAVSYIELGATVAYGTPLIRTKELFPSGAVVALTSDTDIYYTVGGISEEDE